MLARIAKLEMLRPRLFVPSIFAINLEGLYADGLRGLIVDLDNTLVPWNEPAVPAALAAWVARARRLSFGLCVVSNNRAPRVDAFADQLGLPRIAEAAKPRRRAFREAMRIMGTAAETTAVIGDQLFTDVLGGNRLRLYTILVLPLAEREFWTTRWVRRLERRFHPRRDDGRRYG
jgi:HAD superfamily phosphatase (TIGR01668 family)